MFLPTAICGCQVRVGCLHAYSAITCARGRLTAWLRRLVFGAVQYALSGVPSGHVLGGLAYDPAGDALYLASADSNGATLWRVQLDHDAQTATATPVESLPLTGYPAGLQPTALGWVPARAGDANDDGCVDDADLLEVLFNFGSGC